MGMQEQRQELRAVALANSEASAELVATMLQAHGIVAVTGPTAVMHPSVDWVEGYRVSVALEQIAQANELLRLLRERDDVVPTPDPDE